MGSKRYRGGKPIGGREVVMLATSLTILAAACYAAEQAPAAAEPERPVMELVIVEPEVEETVEVEPVPDEDEAELIEEALTCQGYLRDDIPLSYEEQDFLHAACEEFGIQYELAVAVIWKETNFRNISGDNGNSKGYMQIQERHHKDRMASLGVTDLSDPYSNFRVGCSFLSELIDRYDGNIEMALMSYNAGAGGANKYWFSQGVYTNSYSQKVLEYIEGLLDGAN